MSTYKHATLIAALATAVMALAMVIPAWHAIALIIIMLPLWAIDNLGVADLGSPNNGFFEPNFAGYLVAGLMVWLVCFFIVWMSERRRRIGAVLMDIRHVKVADFHFTLFCITILAGIAVLAKLLNRDASTPLFGYVIGLLFLVSFSVFNYFIAVGAKNRKPWARLVSRSIALLLIVSVPVGTLFGIYLFINCREAWNESTPLPA